MKPRWAVFLFLSLACLVLLLVQQRLFLHAETQKAKSPRPTTRPAQQYFPGRLIVKFKSGIEPTAVPALMKAHQIADMRPLFQQAQDKFVAAHQRPGLSRIFMLDVPPQEDLELLAAELQKDASVEYAEPDYLIPLEAIPSDSLFARQQYLPQIKAPQAWEIGRGDSSVIIAIIDSGTDWQHPDLAANVWRNVDEILDGLDNDNNGFIDDVRGWDFVDGAPNAYPGEDAATPDNDPMDFAGHGTGVAGVAAAVTNNARGIAALSWNVKLMPLRVGWLRIDGVSLVDVAWTAAAFVYAADNGAHVANLSAGSSRVVAEAAAYAFQKGVVITGAAGNASNEEAFGLNTTPFTLSVAGVNDSDEYASYTSFGDWVKVCAPSGDLKRRRPGILTTFLNHGFEELQGTSFAAPLAASLAALVKSQHPGWSPAQITFQVVETADNIDALQPDYLQGKLGRGRINAQRALTETVIAAPQISLVAVKIDDRAGNGNGFWEAGETIQLAVSLRNDWGEAPGLAAEISSEDYAGRVMKSSADFGALPGISDLSGNEKNNAADPFVVSASAEALPHRVAFKLNLRAHGGYQKIFDFHLALSPSILLVDDDDGKNNIENYYTEILDSLGLGFDIFTHANAGLDSNLLKKYATVIWACEWAFPSLNADDRSELQKFLHAGGNLFISGQDIGWDLCDPASGFSNEFNLSAGASQTFYEQFLRARYLRDDANAQHLTGINGDPISDGLQFDLVLPGRTISEYLPSEIFPLAPATGIFKYPNGQFGATRYAGDYRLVYFAFGGYEAIAPKAQRDLVMPRVLNWLNGFQLEHTPLRDTDDTTRARLVAVKIVSEISPPQRVELYWDTDGQLPFHKVAMQSEGDGNYSAAIPPQFNQTVEYFFFVTTARGFAAPLQKYSYSTFPDLIPPVLENLSQVQNSLYRSAPRAISVNIHDVNGVDTANVKVHYRSSAGDSGFSQMFPNPERPGEFHGGLGGGYDYGDTVFYRVMATDLALNRNRAATPEKYFLIGLHDFEYEFLREWVIDSSGSPLSAWGITTTKAFSGAVAAHSNPGRNYPLNFNSALASFISFDENAVELSFVEQHFFQDSQEDFGILEIRNSQSSVWQAVSTEFRGTQGQWQKQSFIIPRPLNTSAGYFRFRVQTDNQRGLPKAGWFIDDVRLKSVSSVSVCQPEAGTLPTAFHLAQNYPNPFSPGTAAKSLTAIRVELPAPAEINITVFDLLGRRVANLISEKKAAGVHHLFWRGEDDAGRRVAAGIYVYRMRALSAEGKTIFQSARKLAVLPE